MFGTHTHTQYLCTDILLLSSLLVLYTSRRSRRHRDPVQCTRLMRRDPDPRFSCPRKNERDWLIMNSYSSSFLGSSWNLVCVRVFKVQNFIFIFLIIDLNHARDERVHGAEDGLGTMWFNRMIGCEVEGSTYIVRKWGVNLFTSNIPF